MPQTLLSRHLVAEPETLDVYVQEANRPNTRRYVGRAPACWNYGVVGQRFGLRDRLVDGKVRTHRGTREWLLEVLS